MLVNNLHLINMKCPSLLCCLKPVGVSCVAWDGKNCRCHCQLLKLFSQCCSGICNVRSIFFIYVLCPAHIIHSSRQADGGQSTVSLWHCLAGMSNVRKFLCFQNSIAVGSVWLFVWSEFQNITSVTFYYRHTVRGSWFGDIAWCARCTVVIWESQGWELSAQGDPSTGGLADQS